MRFTIPYTYCSTFRGLNIIPQYFVEALFRLPRILAPRRGPGRGGEPKAREAPRETSPKRQKNGRVRVPRCP